MNKQKKMDASVSARRDCEFSALAIWLGAVSRGASAAAPHPFIFVLRLLCRVRCILQKVFFAMSNILGGTDLSIPDQDKWELASSGGKSSRQASPRDENNVDNRSMDEEVDDIHTLYVGPIKVCECCDEKSDSDNVFFLSRAAKAFFTRTPVFYRRKFKVWGRYDKSNFAESCMCLLCAMFSYHGYRAKGGKKYLATVAKGGEPKTAFKMALKEFIQRVMDGLVVTWKAAPVLVEELACTNEKSIMEEKHYDVYSENYADDNNINYGENEKQNHKGTPSVWILASTLFPPVGAVRVVCRDGDRLSHKKTLDHSGRSVRTGQLDEHFSDLSTKFTAGTVILGPDINDALEGAGDCTQLQSRGADSSGSNFLGEGPEKTNIRKGLPRSSSGRLDATVFL